MKKSIHNEEWHSLKKSIHKERRAYEDSEKRRARGALRRGEDCSGHPEGEQRGGGAGQSRPGPGGRDPHGRAGRGQGAAGGGACAGRDRAALSAAQ